MEKFESKVDFSIVFFLSLLFGGMLVKSISDEIWIATVILSFVIAFIIHMFLTTYYIIDGEILTIKYGFFFSISLDIKDVKRISESYNIMSSPALSFNRFEILYYKFDTVLISPKDKIRFIEAIKKINPQVEIKINPKLI